MLKPEIETAKPASVVLQYHANPNSITTQTLAQSISKLTSFLPLSSIFLKAFLSSPSAAFRNFFERLLLPPAIYFLVNSIIWLFCPC